MGNVYSLDAERNLILYRSGTNLYIRSTSGESLTRPVTLCTDYKDNLSDTTYNGTVYYAYRSTEQDIIVRSITDLQNIYKMNSHEIPDCRDPRLITFREHLILFYTTKSPLNNAYYLKAVFPLNPEKRISLPETAFLETINLGILVMPDKLILSVVSPNKQLLFSLNTTFEPTIYSSDSPALKGMLDTATRQLDDTQQKLSDTMQKLADTSSARNDAQQKFDAASRQLNDMQQQLGTTTDALALASKELQTAKLLTQELTAKNAKLEDSLRAQSKAHNEMIENIRAQYNELMETATRYREEAIRWHDIAYKKEAKPIPGESLITDNW